MERAYHAITTGEAFARMRADAARLSSDCRIGWTSRDTVFPTPLGVLCLAASAGLVSVGALSWPPAIIIGVAALVVGVTRIRDCVVTVAYIPRL